MTDADILLEYEAGLAFDGEIIKECPVCSRKTHRTRCPRCKNPDGSPLSLSGDKQMDNIVARIEAGEEIEDLDALLRGGFEPVPRG